MPHNTREAEERTKELSLLLEITKDMAQTLELKAVTTVALEKLKTVVNYTSAAFFIMEGEDVHLLDYQGQLSPTEALPLRALPEHAYLSQEVLRHGRVCIIGDVWSDCPLTQAVQESASVDQQCASDFRDRRSLLGVPLIMKKQVIGMLRIDSSEPNVYTPHHAEIALAVATQVAVAVENARLYERTQNLAILNERQRLAHELHDSVAQVLYCIELGATTAREELDNDPKQAIEPLEYVISLAKVGLVEIRTLIFELQPESLSAEGLISALHKQVAVLRTRYKLKVDAYLYEEPDISITIKQALYHIAREAFYNTIRHAQATTVSIRLTKQAHEIILEVHDDGLGFDTKETFIGHFGLHSMQERIALLNGTLLIKSVAGQGTEIYVRIPH